MVVQCKKTGRMAIITTWLRLPAKKEHNWIYSGMGFDGKSWDSDSVLKLADSLDEYLKIC